MVSDAKRMRYVSDNELSCTESEDYDDMEYAMNSKTQTSNNKQGAKKTNKWLSKNAIMARENRLKKKMYISSLENENSKLKTENRKYSQILDNQSNLIAHLKREIKYFKSVICNSSDIGKLLKNIHQSSGMSVTTSLDQTLSLNNDCISKQKHPIARKTAHPWEETQSYPSFPTPESNCDNGFDNSEIILNDVDLNSPLTDISDDIFNSIDPFPIEEPFKLPINSESLFEEHNYTTATSDNQDEDAVGVCLHVSKHRVSLEFCSFCNENATKAWND